MTDSINAGGGVSAPISVTYDIFTVALDDASLRAAQDAAWEWWTTPSDVQPDETYVDGAAEKIVRAYLEAQHRNLVKRSLPKITPPRGGIRYTVPPFGPVTRRARMKIKYINAKKKAMKPVNHYRRFVKRVNDTRDVWAGRQTAYADEQIEAMTDVW